MRTSFGVSILDCFAGLAASAGAAMARLEIAAPPCARDPMSSADPSVTAGAPVATSSEHCSCDPCIWQLARRCIAAALMSLVATVITAWRHSDSFSTSYSTNIRWDCGVCALCALAMTTHNSASSDIYRTYFHSGVSDVQRNHC